MKSDALAVLTGSMIFTRANHQLTRLQDGRVLVTGGTNGSTPVGSLERFDPATGVFSFIGGSMLTPRFHHTATLLLDGRVLVVGGYLSSTTVTSTAEIYNPATSSWSNAGPTNVPHAKHTATRLADGRVLIVGGFSVHATNPVGVSNVEIYNPATNQWTTLGQLPVGRYDHRAVTLPNGNVLVVGGINSTGYSGPFQPVELSPTGVFTERLSPFSNTRIRHLAFSLPSGKVLITGGSFIGNVGNESELYDPATQTFAPTANFPSPRSWAQGAVMADGSVLVSGGWTTGGGALNSTVVYTPSTDTWNSGDPMVVRRSQAASTLLADGRFLVAGGFNELGTIVTSAELYTAPACGAVSCGASSCGTKPDGCGGTLDCGSCGSGQVCAANVCCAPTTCLSQGLTCGVIADGCGGSLDCGSCSGGQVCAANTCCSPTSCVAQGANCGSLANGCGATLNCGTCGSGQLCAANSCVACTPITCSQIGANCGSVPDGCGGTVSCGSCGSNPCVMNVCTPWADLSAAYDSNVKAPRCALGRSCDSGTLLVGRGAVGLQAELNTPNTVANSCVDGIGGTFHVDESLDRLKISSYDGNLISGNQYVRIDATVWARTSYSSDKLDLYVATNPDSPTWNLITTLTPTNAGQNVLSYIFLLPEGSYRQVIRAHFRFGGVATPCSGSSYSDTDDLVFDVYGFDVTPPSITINSPVAGATLHGPNQTIEVTAADATGVKLVQYYAGTTYLGSKGPPFTSPPHFLWNSAVVPDGPVNLFAKAFDRSGNLTTSASRAVTIDNTPPNVALTSPADGASLRDDVLLTASASDVSGVTSVSFLLDGVVINTDPTAPFEFSWASTSTSDGAHTLQARATDSLTLVTTTPAVNVVVDHAAPSVAISAPAELEVVHGISSVTATITDLSSITRVEFFDGTTSLGVLMNAPWSLTWSTLFAGEGAHQLSAVALDAAGNSAASPARNVQVSNAPSIAITAPTAASSVSGPAVVLAADAAALDGRSITQVDFWVDGALVATVNASPFFFSWNSRTVSNGAHVVTARATDSAFFTHTTAPTAFNTTNDFTPPQIAVTTPAAGAATRGEVSLAADAADDQGVAQVDFFIDGAWVGASTASPFVFSWSSTTATNGSHTVSARATDAASNATDSQLVSFSVDNEAPVTSLTAPAAGAWVAGQVNLTASASDNASVQRVEFYEGANLISTDFAAPYVATWQTTGLNGSHVLTSQAFDLAGNQTTSAGVTVTVLAAQVATYNATLKTPRCSTLGISCDTGSSVVGRGPLGPEPSRPNTINASCADGTAGSFHGTGESLDRLVVATVGGGALIPGAQVRVTATVWARNGNDRLDIWRAPNANSPSWVLVATLTPTVFDAASTLQTTFTLPSGSLQAVRGSLRRNGSAVACPSGSNNDRDDVVFVTQ